MLKLEANLLAKSFFFCFKNVVTPGPPLYVNPEQTLFLTINNYINEKSKQIKLRTAADTAVDRSTHLTPTQHHGICTFALAHKCMIKNDGALYMARNMCCTTDPT